MHRVGPFSPDLAPSPESSAGLEQAQIAVIDHEHLVEGVALQMLGPLRLAFEHLDRHLLAIDHSELELLLAIKRSVDRSLQQAVRQQSGRDDVNSSDQSTVSGLGIVWRVF